MHKGGMEGQVTRIGVSQDMARASRISQHACPTYSSVEGWRQAMQSHLLVSVRHLQRRVGGSKRFPGCGQRGGQGCNCMLCGWCNCYEGEWETVVGVIKRWRKKAAGFKREAVKRWTAGQGSTSVVNALLLWFTTRGIDEGRKQLP